MKRSPSRCQYVLKSCITVIAPILFVFPIFATNEAENVETYLTLLERNSIARKILEVSCSVALEGTMHDKSFAQTNRAVYLVFDAETGKYREEEKVYDKANSTDSYLSRVGIWNGKEYVSVERHVSQRPGTRAIGAGVYETPGSAVILNYPYKLIPSYAGFFYDWNDCLFSKASLKKNNPTLMNTSGDTVIIRADGNKFELSRKTGVLKRLEYIDHTKNPCKIYEFSNHLECSGVWLPLRVVETISEPTSRLFYKKVYTVDPLSIRLIDKVDDSLFNESLQAGCVVNDQIRKREYVVTTVASLPNDVEAVKKALEKMLNQAEEQKAAVEQKK